MQLIKLALLLQPRSPVFTVENLPCSHHKSLSMKKKKKKACLWDVSLGPHINIDPAHNSYLSWRSFVISYPHVPDPIWDSPTIGNSLRTARAPTGLSPRHHLLPHAWTGLFWLQPCSFLLWMGGRKGKMKGEEAVPLRDVESFSALLS